MEFLTIEIKVTALAKWIASAEWIAISSATSAIHAGMAKLIIAGTFLFVGKNFVSLGNFLKFFFGFFVAGVFVRMVFNGELSISFFNLVIRCVF